MHNQKKVQMVEGLEGQCGIDLLADFPFFERVRWGHGSICCLDSMLASIRFYTAEALILTCSYIRFKILIKYMRVLN